NIGRSNASDWFPLEGASVPSGQVAFLLIHNLAIHRYLVLAQADSNQTTTWAGNFAPDTPNSVSTSALYSSCTHCAPRLLDRPTAIALPAFEATGVAQFYDPLMGYQPDALSTDAAIMLDLAPPASLTWDELTTLNTATSPDGFSSDVGLHSFNAEGDDMVAHR